MIETNLYQPKPEIPGMPKGSPSGGGVRGSKQPPLTAHERKMETIGSWWVCTALACFFVGMWFNAHWNGEQWSIWLQGLGVVMLPFTVFFTNSTPDRYGNRH